jgi:hypothetical protein
MNRLRALHDAGVSIWLDNLEELLGQIEAKASRGAGKDRGRTDANSMTADRVGGRRD